jgi:hydrogenase nickel incorporation protein HypB
MFKSASVVILNKLDIIEHTNFDINEFYRDIRVLNKDIKVFEVSCKDNRGIEDLSNYLKTKIRDKKIMNI